MKKLCDGGPRARKLAVHEHHPRSSAANQQDLREVWAFTPVRATDYPADRVGLIHINSDSADDSVRMAKSWGARLIELREPPVIAPKGWQRDSALLRLFLDGDCEVSPGVLALRYRGLPTGPGSLMGGNHVCRQPALEAVGGFNTSLDSGEITYLGSRIRLGSGLRFGYGYPLSRRLR